VFVTSHRGYPKGAITVEDVTEVNTMIMPGSDITAEYEFTVNKAGKGLINFYPD